MRWILFTTSSGRMRSFANMGYLFVLPTRDTGQSLPLLIVEPS